MIDEPAELADTCGPMMNQAQPSHKSEAIQPSPGSTKRVRELDGIRGLAILLVIVWHYIACTVPPLQAPLWLRYLRHALMFTWSGVDLFFVLSGFLIAGILMDNKGKDGYFKVFYLRRACRILPLYVLAVGSFLALVYSGLLSQWGGTRFDCLTTRHIPLWSYLTFTQNIAMGNEGTFGSYWLGVTWSLAIEEQFYLVFPLIVMLMPRRLLVGFLILLMVASPLIRYYLTPSLAAFTNTLARTDGLAAGALIACLVRDEGGLRLLARWKTSLRIFLALLLVSVAVVLVCCHNKISPVTHRPWTAALQHSWLIVLYSSLILLPLVGMPGLLGKMLSLSPLVFLGQVSYGLYMCHQLVLGLVHGVLRRDAPSVCSVDGALVTILALAISIGLAALSYFTFERYFLRKGSAYKYGPAIR